MINWTALIVFIVLFVFVTVPGVRRGALAARATSTMLHEWGLGGRRFGTWVTWFLIGGDLYTAYTFIAVPALMFGAGAIGFFAVPYTIMVYPDPLHRVPAAVVGGAQARLRHRRPTSCVAASAIAGSRWRSRSPASWRPCRISRCNSSASRWSSAPWGIETSGLGGDLPLIIAFVILAAFTYTSGLRAPAMIAIVKDVLIYITVIAAVIVVPIHLGGYDKMFGAIPRGQVAARHAAAGSLGSFSAYATLALGSACALFLYPHSITGVLSASSARVVRRNAAALPAYSMMLGLLALVGFMAIAVGVQSMPEFAEGFKRYGNNFAVPALFMAIVPVLVRRRRVRRNRHRCAGAGGDHVDRHRQPVHPQHLPRVHPPGLHRRRRKPDGQDRLAGDQGRRAGVHLRHPVPIRDLAAAAGRGMDHPDAAGGDPWALHAHAERLGAADRLGVWHSASAPGWRAR